MVRCARSAGGVASMVFLGFMAYAVLRYHAFKGVSWEHVALYTVNKALAMTSTALILIAAIAGSRNRGAQTADSNGGSGRSFARQIGFLGAYAALAHTVASFVLLNPGNFADFFKPDGTYAARCEVALIAGTFAALFLLRLATVGSPAAGDRWRLARTCLLLTAGHTALIGFPNWLTPGKWPGGMPPLTLIGFFIAASILFFTRGASPGAQGSAGAR